MTQRFRSSRPSNKARLLRPRSERSGRLSGPPSSVVETSPVSETLSIPSPEAQDLYERDSVEPAESAVVSAPVDDALTDPPPPVEEHPPVVEAAAPVEVAPIEVAPASLPAGTPRQLSAAIIPPPPEPVIKAAPEEAVSSEPWPSMAKVEHLLTETPPPAEVSSTPPPVESAPVSASGVSPTSGKKKKKEKKGKKAKEGASVAPSTAPAAASAAKKPSGESTQKTLLAVSSAPAATISEAPRAPLSEPPVSERDHMDSLEPTARSVAPSVGDSSSKHRSLSDSSARHERAKNDSGRHKLEDDPMAAEFFSVPPPEVEEHFEDYTPPPPPSPAALQRQKMARKVVTGVVAVASLVVLVGVGRWLFGGRPADAQPTATPNGGSNSHQVETKVQEPPNTEPGPAVAPEVTAAATEPAPVVAAEASAAPVESASASASAEASASASASASAVESAVASASAAPAEDVKELRKKVMKLLDRGDNKGAIEAATAVLKQDETDSMMWLMLGTAYQSMGKMADAREAFNNCVRKGKGGHVGECAYFGGKK